MAVEEPVGFTEDGKLITAYRLTEADKADIFMANEMYSASPECQEQWRAALESLPTTSGTFSFDVD